MEKVPESQLKCIAEAQSLSRNVLVTSLLLSFTFLVAAYTSFASWDRLLVLQWEEKAEANKGATPNFFDKLKEQHATQWLARRSINISLLGINLGVHDIVPIAAMTFPTVALWTFFTLRRERLVYTRLWEEHVDEGERLEIYKYIADRSVFFRLDERSKTGFLPTLIPYLVTFSPCVAFGVVFALDIGAIYMNDLFEPGNSGMKFDHRMKYWLCIVYPTALLLLGTCANRCRIARSEFLRAEAICVSFGLKSAPTTEISQDQLRDNTRDP